MDSEPFVQRISAMAAALPGALPTIRQAAEADGLGHPLIERLSTMLTERAQRCVQVLQGPSAEG